jgi:hypothetical protein
MAGAERSQRLSRVHGFDWGIPVVSVAVVSAAVIMLILPELVGTLLPGFSLLSRSPPPAARCSPPSLVSPTQPWPPIPPRCSCAWILPPFRSLVLVAP